jgi:propionyl-CoA carboxylase alpha chain
VNRPITCVLVANRGEVVSRVARTARAMGILSAAVYTDSDAGSRYLDDVDVSIPLGEDASPSPYLDPDRLIEAALLAGADAIHPGYGFLAENAAFATAVAEAGLVWIGPGPDAIAAMGRKVEAKELAARAGVPVLESVTVGEDLDEAATLAAALPLPVLVKPSAGGGGKGMQVVREPGELRPALERARREALSSFGDGTLFVERYLEHPRHVEVQLVADSQGTVVHLGERDCSIQRRHQKIVEESPAPGLDDDLRREICTAAVRLAEAIGYESAGTVECLVDDGRFWFLEMNTRLQVEHGVTEEVTGLDIVELQLRVAAGEPLPVQQQDIRTTGHAIQVRLYAEDPRNDYLPSPGLVTRFEHPEHAGLRWENGIRAGAMIGTRFDPRVSKVIARGGDRTAAAGLLVGALRGTLVEGIHTNRQLLIDVLSDPDFRAGLVSTDFLDRRPALLAGPLAAVDGHAVAATLTLVDRHRSQHDVHAFAPTAWRNLRSQPRTCELELDGAETVVAYSPQRDGSWLVAVGDGEEALATVHGHVDGELDLAYAGRRRRYRLGVTDEQVWVSTSDGRTVAFRRRDEQVAGDATGAAAAVANVPGVVVAVHVTLGDAVTAGDPLASIESMKMEHTVRAATDGVISDVHVKVGESVASQQVLVTVEAAASDE